MDEASTQIPRWLLNLGIIALPVPVFLGFYFIYAQTWLPWSTGHYGNFGYIEVLAPVIILFLLASVVFLVSALLWSIFTWMEQKRLPHIPWVLVILPLAAFSTFFIPDGVLTRATINVMGLGSHPTDYLINASIDGDKKTIEFLLDHGVPVDARGGGVTPLDEACMSGHFDVGQFLLSKGADRSRAPDCWKMFPDNIPTL
jgi:Ankyrin repeats (many copies)